MKDIGIAARGNQAGMVAINPPMSIFSRNKVVLAQVYFVSPDCVSYVLYITIRTYSVIKFNVTHPHL